MPRIPLNTADAQAAITGSHKRVVHFAPAAHKSLSKPKAQPKKAEAPVRKGKPHPKPSAKKKAKR